MDRTSSDSHFLQLMWSLVSAVKGPSSNEGAMCTISRDLSACRAIAMSRLMQYIMMAAANSFSANSRIDPSGSNLTYTVTRRPRTIVRFSAKLRPVGLQYSRRNSTPSFLLKPRMRDSIGTALLSAISIQRNLLRTNVHQTHRTRPVFHCHSRKGNHAD